jgi:integral membrane protein
MTSSAAQTPNQSVGNSPARLYKAFALGEGVTWTLLISALIIRALVDSPPILLTVVGSIHGTVFLGYGVIASLVGVNNRWGLGRTVLAVALAIVPFATIPFERYVERSGKLDGAWRRTATDDPRDSHWFDRLYRWFLNRPALFALVLLLAVAAIFITLITLGPPGGTTTE